MMRIMSGLTTKNEKDLAMERELRYLQSQICRPNLSSCRMRELLTRGIYCEVLGFPATFLYIYAIKLAQQGSSMADKRMGYLAASVFLNEDHELTLLLINTILKDLQSTNISEVSMALTASAFLANKEMVSVVLGTIEGMMHSHPKALIRKKAILTFQRLLVVNSTFANNNSSLHLCKCIEDNDPEVVSTLIQTLSHLVKDNPKIYKDLLEPCLGILRQILYRKFPSDYDYHTLPAPWLQIEILKLLPFLSNDNPTPISQVLEEVLRNIDTNHTMSNAILYQCVCTIISTCPQGKTLEAASNLVSQFLNSSKIDMNYMGLKALTLMVTKINVSYASPHQEFIIESLRHPDASIRSKTFELLICLVNPSNINVVWPKLLRHVETVVDECLKNDLIIRCSCLLQIQSLNTVWAFENTLSLIFMSPSQVHPQLILILRAQLLKENQKTDFVSMVIVKCFEILKTTSPSHDLIEFCVWVLCNYVKQDHHLVLKSIAQLLPRFPNDHQVQSSLLLAIKKLIVENEKCIVEADVENLIQCCFNSSHCLIRQRSRELSQILKSLDHIRTASASISELTEYDWTLSFLDNIVGDSVMTAPYLPKGLRTKHDGANGNKTSNVLNQTTTTSRKSSMSSSFGSSCLNVNYFEKVWSKDGFRIDNSQISEADDNSLKKSCEHSTEDTELAEALFYKLDVEEFNEVATAPPINPS